MEQLYSYLLTDKEEVPLAEFEQKGVLKEHIYIDLLEQTEQWERLLEELKEGDTLYISSIKSIATSSFGLNMKMKECFKLRIVVKDLNEQIISPKMIIDTIDFIIESDRKTAYKRQMAGIQRALDEKRKGLKNYGRPYLDVPADFEKNIKKVLDKKMTHEEYRKKIGFKKSTYFAKVKEVKNSWEQ